MEKIMVFTAFSGYDSQCMALDRLGIDYELVGWSEFNPDSKQQIDNQPAVIAHNAVYPQWSKRNYGDIKDIVWDDVPDFDLFTYSFPCQDISSAGLCRGFDEGSGTRSALLWECRRAIECKKPRFLVMENVKPLVGKKNRPNFERWLSYLESQGYSNFWKVLNAKDYGVPQNRERVFCISIIGGGYEFPKPFKLTTRLKDVLDKDVDEKYYLSQRCIDGFNKHNERHEDKGTGFLFRPKDLNKDDYASCLRANSALAPTDNTVLVECMNTDKDGNASCIKAGYYKMGRANFLEHQHDGFKATCVKEYGNRRVQRIVDSGKINPEKVTFIDAYNQAVNDSVANTIKTTVDSSCMTFVSEPVRIDDASPVEELLYRIRKFTPRECFRLMGVSEENIDKIQSAGISNSQQYKMAGNSIVVDVLFYIFKELFYGNVQIARKEPVQLTLF